MVDGTTIQIFEKPHYYGESLYDWVRRYSINAQIINTPNRHIIDYATGFNGSRHDNLFLAHSSILRTYSVVVWRRMVLVRRGWLMISYKRPSSLLKENREFNFALSRARIRSEHAIGYLKWRCQSLKEFRVRSTIRRISPTQAVGYKPALFFMCLALTMNTKLTRSGWRMD